MEHKAAAAASRALKLALSEGSFKSEDVQRAFARPPSRHTVRRVLRQLEEDDWLRRESEDARIWRAGMQARMLGDLSDRALQEADRDPVEAGEETRGGFDFEL